MVGNGFSQPWALVLAAGDGNRLNGLTADPSGVHVPKQFCALASERTMLEDSLARAARVVPRSRIATVVAAQHRRWWEPVLRGNGRRGCIVQPANRGTGFGVLLPVLTLVEEDPEALVVVYPSDHFVRDEATLARSIRAAVHEFQRNTGDRSPILLGITPGAPDPDLGYIVPSDEPAGGGPARVERFVEKPDRLQALEMVREGALWNSFIFVTPGRSVVERFESSFPRETDELRAALHAKGGRDARLGEVYLGLPTVDFSTFFFAEARRLRVQTVPPCGWSDLGTPERLRSCRKALLPTRASLDFFTDRSVENLIRYAAATVHAPSPY